MDAIPTIQAHSLMTRSDTPSGHSTKPSGRATTSAFASYGFGPLESGKAANTGVKPVTGNYGQQQLPTNAGNLSWITQLQATAGVNPGR